MSDITLSLGTRSNLLALQTTQSLLQRTSNRLSTGLKVNKPIDDASAFFAAAALNNRANNQTRAQTDISQTSSALETAISGLKSISKLVQTVQGVLSSLANASTAETSGALVAQYNTLLGQIDNLANSTNYQGVNLINTATTSLNVSFSGTPGGSDLSISSIRSDSAGLNLSTIATGLFFTVVTTISSQSSRTSIASIASVASTQSRLAVNGSPALASTGTVASRASVGSFASVASQASNATNASAPAQSSVPSTDSVASIASRQSVAAINAAGAVASAPSVASSDSVGSAGSVGSAAGAAVAGVNTSLLTAVNFSIGNALARLETSQSTLGATNAILAVRLEFSKSYVATLQSGAANLTTADLNEESANLTSLQTAQSLGVVSLSISNQAQQSLLRLF
jgi:flagellin